jgi:ubiquinone biosynthesis monooxygenase Coq7
MPKPYFASKAKLVAEIIRVNQAGEYAANVIYQTQINNTGNIEVKRELQQMLSEEENHLQFFNNEMIERRVRPTALQPLWHCLSWGLGKISAGLGQKHMMIATEAVEEVIQEHYNEQIDSLHEIGEDSLRDHIMQFREDEIHHQKIAADQIQHKNVFDEIFAFSIRQGCKMAILISKKI